MSDLGKENNYIEEEINELKKRNIYTIPVNVTLHVRVAAKDVDKALERFNDDPNRYIKKGEVIDSEIGQSYYWEHPLGTSIHNLYESVFNRRLIK